jgi:hypothetical protein
MRRRAAEKQPVHGLARAAGVVIRRCSRQSPPEPASRTLRGQPGPVPGVPAVPEPSGRHWCLPGGSGSLRARPPAEVGDVRPLALAAAAGVRHADGRRTTAGGLPSAREQVPSHAHAAWRPYCAADSRATAARARCLPEKPRSTAEEHPAPARSMAWPLPLSWRGCGGPRAATSTGKPVAAAKVARRLSTRN